MSTGGLKDALSWRDVERAADDRQAFDQSLPLADLSRLAPQLAETRGAAHAYGRFFREFEVPRVEFDVEAELALTCQRCLGSMRWPVHAQASIALVQDLATADRLPEGIDPVVMEDGERTSVRELAEEELLLALPLVARHEDPRDCVAVENDIAASLDEAVPEDDETNVSAEPTNKPFAQLAELLKRGR